MVSPEARVKAAWVVLWLSVIGWPVSQFTFASSEPPTILGLSWGAMILTALGVVATTDVRREQDEEEGGPGECPHCGKTLG